MTKTIEQTCQSFDMSSPDSFQLQTNHIIGLVDDKRQYINDWEDNSEQKLCENLQTAASSLEQMLHTSGEGLELTKCAWYLIKREFMENKIPYTNKKQKNKQDNRHQII